MNSKFKNLIVVVPCTNLFWNVCWKENSVLILCKNFNDEIQRCTPIMLIYSSPWIIKCEKSRRFFCENSSTSIMNDTMWIWNVQLWEVCHITSGGFNFIALERESFFYFSTETSLESLRNSSWFSPFSCIVCLCFAC